MSPRKGFLRLIAWVGLALCLTEGIAEAKQMAVIVNKANSAQDLSTADIEKIFKCALRAWPGAVPITVLVRDPSSPEMELMLSRIYKFSPDELKSFIAAHREAIVIVDSNEAMLSAVHNIPGAIGLIDVFHTTQDVKVVKINGKLPIEFGYILRGN